MSKVSPINVTSSDILHLVSKGSQLIAKYQPIQFMIRGYENDDVINHGK